MFRLCSKLFLPFLEFVLLKVPFILFFRTWEAAERYVEEFGVTISSVVSSLPVVILLMAARSFAAESTDCLTSCYSAAVVGRGSSL